MSTKPTNRDGELTAAFHREMDKFLNAILSDLKAGKLSQAQALGYLAHIIALMHNEGATSVAGYFDALNAKPAATRWTL